MSSFYLYMIPLFLLTYQIFTILLTDPQLTGGMTDQEGELPAIGIALTAAYGTLSARYPNGSFVDVTQIDADPTYISMMHRLSNQNAQHPSPPYSTAEEYWDDILRQLVRSGRKTIGLPASTDVGTISALIKSLLDKAVKSDSLPSESLEAVVISYPPIVALYSEDINDAACYLGIRALTGQSFHQPPEIVAAYAGHGMGLCTSYTDSDQCTEEGLGLPERHTLLVEYTTESILLQYKIMREADDLAMSDIATASDFGLGSKDRLKDGYVEDVEAFLKSFLSHELQFSFPPSSILVIITGSTETEAQDKLKKIIEVTVAELVEDVELKDERAEYVASRGAAELSWRAKAVE